MDSLELISRMLPEHHAMVRSRFWRDVRFRLVCEDCRDAWQALVRLEEQGPAAGSDVDHYRELLADLLAEAKNMLGENA